jgi:hypothetical protein
MANRAFPVHMRTEQVPERAVDNSGFQICRVDMAQNQRPVAANIRWHE